MARRTGIGDLVFVGHARWDEAEGVRADERARHTFALDLGHVAGNATAALTARFVVGVFFESRGVRTIGRGWGVTVETDFVPRFPQLGIVFGSVNIVTGCAGYAVAIHHALDEIVPLHAVFVGGTVGEL